MPRVLLVEDEPAVATAMIWLLEAAGFDVAHAGSGAEAMRLKPVFQPDIAVVDLQLPDTSGVSLVRWLAGQGDCAVLVLSGLSEEIDRVTCLELGADDDVVKPPTPRELVARLHALHRRSAAVMPSRLAVGGAQIDLEARQITDPTGAQHALTAAESAVLAILAAAGGHVVSRDTLFQAVLHRPWRAEDRSIDQLIFQLRRKLAPDDRGRRLIQSERGAGYRLVPDKS